MKDVNSLLVKYSRRFNKQRKAASLEVKIAFRETREMFLDNPSHPSLRDHPLKEKFVGYRSIDITGDYRAIYKKRIEGNREIITFHMIGMHEELYGK